MFLEYGALSLFLTVSLMVNEVSRDFWVYEVHLNAPWRQSGVDFRVFEAHLNAMLKQGQHLSVKLSHHAGFTPTMVRTFRAILRCRPHSSMDEAIKRPLRKRKLVSRKYWGHNFLDGRIPSVGKRQTGSIAVTARGRASVHQNIAISNTT